MKGRDRLRYRRQTVGFIWQQTARNLLPYLTAARERRAADAASPARSASPRGAAPAELLDLLGVGYCADRRPGQMSGGEQQRVAIAVALANDPEVVFADEPTGELDSATSQQVFDALRTANQELGVSIVVVTHDHEVTDQVQRTIEIRDGRTSTEVLRRAGGRGPRRAVRGAGPGRAGAAAEGVPGGAEDEGPGAGGEEPGPHRGLAGSGAGVG